MNSEIPDKKKFDKKKWREKKYNKGIRVQEWNEKRKKILMRNCQREMRKTSIPVLNENRNKINAKQKGDSSVKAAQLEYQRIVKEKKQKKEERLQKQKEIKEALEQYKKKKTEKFKKLSKKTKKGQPLMKEKLELMLEKVKKCVNSQDC